MSLACAVREPIIDTGIVREVISDLDITQHVSQPGAAGVAGLSSGTVAEEEYDWAAAKAGEVHPKPGSGLESRKRGRKETLTPTEARAYLQQIAGTLKGGRP
jgi:hypothetical protein